jgi:hypothetical protein
MGTLGANTNLFICTGNPDINGGPFGNENQIRIDNVGNMTLSNGGLITPVTPATPNNIGGVELQNSNVTALMNISVGNFSSLALTSSNRCTTFIVTSASGNTINLSLPGSSIPRGTFWVVKNAVGSIQTINTAGGTFVGGLSTLAISSLTTIVYSGAGGNYYAL